MKILAILGSLQARSANRALLQAALSLPPGGTEIVVYDSLAELPHFNPDLESDGRAVPPAVTEFRAQLELSSALLIVTPEYAHSMPGALKNALDWLVGSGELAGKPVALLSASTVQTGGARAQIALTTTLLAQAANVVAWLTVPGIRAKLPLGGELADEATRTRIGETLRALAEAIPSGQGVVPPG